MDNLGFIAAVHFDTPEKRASLRDAERRIQQLPAERDVSPADDETWSP